MPRKFDRIRSAMRRPWVRYLALLLVAVTVYQVWWFIDDLHIERMNGRGEVVAQMLDEYKHRMDSYPVRLVEMTAVLGVEPPGPGWGEPEWQYERMPVNELRMEEGYYLCVGRDGVENPEFVIDPKTHEWTRYDAF